MMQVPRQPAGFTLIELMLVIMIICVLAVYALPRFADTGAQAQRVAVRSMGGSLASAVTMVRGQWLVQGVRAARQDLPGFGAGDVDVTAAGWPAGREGNTGPAMTTATCMELWRALLQGTPPAAAVGAGNSDYEVRAVDDLQGGAADCLYVYRLSPANRIRYDADRGEITVENDDRE